MRMVYHTAASASPEAEAMTPSTEDVYGSWQYLMKSLEKGKKYKSHEMCCYLEWKTRNGNEADGDNLYDLNLLEPVVEVE